MEPGEEVGNAAPTVHRLTVHQCGVDVWTPSSNPKSNCDTTEPPTAHSTPVGTPSSLISQDSSSPSSSLYGSLDSLSRPLLSSQSTPRVGYKKPGRFPLQKHWAEIAVSLTEILRNSLSAKGIAQKIIWQPAGRAKLPVKDWIVNFFDNP